MEPKAKRAEGGEEKLLMMSRILWLTQNGAYITIAISMLIHPAKRTFISASRRESITDFLLSIESFEMRVWRASNTREKTMRGAAVNFTRAASVNMTMMGR